MDRTTGPTDNVRSINRHKNYALFNPALRGRLEDGLKPFTEKPTEAVESLEQTFCTYLVASLRQAAARIGTRMGEKLAQKVVGS